MKILCLDEPYLPHRQSLVDGEDEYEKDEILDLWIFCNKLQYLDQGQGYGEEDKASWNNIGSQLTIFMLLIFFSLLARYPAKPGNKTSGGCTCR
ncbi:Hypothetical predicted protein, partial [Pelobates cultripes]